SATPREPRRRRPRRGPPPTVKQTPVRGSVRSAPVMRLARVLGAIGRTCITAGVLILLFVAYQLWGTGIREAQAENRLQKQLEQKLAEGNTEGGEAGSTEP